MTARVRRTEWQTRAELLSYMREHGARQIFLGEDAEAPQKYYSFTISSIDATRVIGMQLSWSGIEPGLEFLGGDRVAIVGHDSRVTCIDVAEMKVVGCLRLWGTFYEFLSVGHRDEIVVLHELGAVRVNTSAAPVWSVSTEIVASARVNEDCVLVITLMEAGELRVAVESGAVVRPPLPHL